MEGGWLFFKLKGAQEWKNLAVLCSEEGRDPGALHPGDLQLSTFQRKGVQNPPKEPGFKEQLGLLPVACCQTPSVYRNPVGLQTEMSDFLLQRFPTDSPPRLAGGASTGQPHPSPLPTPKAGMSRIGR